jgi:hypothetical protein
LKGIKIFETVAISYLLFVDSIMIFGHGSIRELKSIKEIIDIYCLATCMEVNMEKSSLLFKELEEATRSQVTNPMPKNHLDIEQGIKYLGFKLKPNYYKYDGWLWLYNKIEVRISIWCNRWLSRGHILVLAKSVLESILMYWMSIAHIPKCILNKIRKRCFNFLWTTKREKEGIPLVKWLRVASPKEASGWGLKNIHVFSLALAAKTLWRLTYNERLWGKVMEVKHLKGKYMEVNIDWKEKVFKEPQLFGKRWLGLPPSWKMGNLEGWKGKPSRVG